jgi:hypothetical protein
MVSLSEDVHALSRQLHPSILDDLGLIDALRSECASVTRREGVAVAYSSDRVSTSLPNDAALCVYRVAQEALRNVVKHAGTQEARVSLVSSDRELVLTIQDRGVGFDSEGARNQNRVRARPIRDPKWHHVCLTDPPRCAKRNPDQVVLRVAFPPGSSQDGPSEPRHSARFRVPRGCGLTSPRDDAAG